ncbi:hypothetical protein Vi05172_g10938 [Venturia inaequalis]|nr:hypothetical protein Vi05172_g10938 [Venturia inaequalis]
MSWFIKTIKAATGVALTVGTAVWYTQAPPHSNSTIPLTSVSLSAIATTSPSTLSSTITSAAPIALSLSTVTQNIGDSHIVDWSSFTDISNLANSSFISSSPILSNATPAGSLSTLNASAISAWYCLLNSSTARDVSPLLSPLHDASNSMEARVHGFIVDIVRFSLSLAAAIIASIWLVLRPVVEDYIVTEPDKAVGHLLAILTKIPMGGRMVFFINSWVDCIVEHITLVIALIAGIVAAPCTMIYMTWQDKLQVFRRQTSQDCYELGMLIFDRFWAYATRPAVHYLMGTEIFPFLYLFYAILSESPNLWRCGQFVIGHYILKVLVRQSLPPQSWHAFIHKFCSRDCDAMIAHQAAIITLQKAKNARFVAKYKKDIGEFLKIRWSVPRKRSSDQQEPGGSNPSNKSSGSYQGSTGSEAPSRPGNGLPASRNSGNPPIRPSDGPTALDSGRQKSNLTGESGSQDDDENSRFERMYALRIRAETTRIRKRVDDSRESCKVRVLQRDLRRANQRIKDLLNANAPEAKESGTAFKPVAVSVTASDPTPSREEEVLSDFVSDKDQGLDADENEKRLVKWATCDPESTPSAIPGSSNKSEGGATSFDNTFPAKALVESSQAPSSLRPALEELAERIQDCSRSSSPLSSVPSEITSIAFSNAEDAASEIESAQPFVPILIQSQTSSTLSTTDAEDSEGSASDTSSVVADMSTRKILPLRRRARNFKPSVPNPIEHTTSSSKFTVEYEDPDTKVETCDSEGDEDTRLRDAHITSVSRDCFTNPDAFLELLGCGSSSEDSDESSENSGGEDDDVE